MRELELSRLSKAVQRLAREDQDSIFILGDLNFHSELENVSIPSGFIDLWSFLRAGDNGYTYDPVTNPMIRRKLSPELLSMRLDRVLAEINIERVIPRSIQLFAGQPIPGEERAGIFPSDHFGIVFNIDAR